MNHFASSQKAQPGAGSLWSTLHFDFEAAEREIRMRRNAINRDHAERELESDLLSEELKLDIRHLLYGAESDEGAPMSRLDERKEGQTREQNLRGEGNRAREESELGDSGSPVRLSVSGQPIINSSYEGMRCAGCDAPFGTRTRRTRITPGGVGMIHNRRACLDKARAALELQASMEGELARTESVSVGPESLLEEPDSEVTCQPCENGKRTARDGGKEYERTGCDQYRQQFRANFSDARKERVFACLEGHCGASGEEPMVCLGRVNGLPCAARLHGRKCAQLTKGHAGLGCFLCPDCRVRKLLPDAEPAEALSLIHI